jgi:hypothetical protein
MAIFVGNGKGSGDPGLFRDSSNKVRSFPSRQIVVQYSPPRGQLLLPKAGQDYDEVRATPMFSSSDVLNSE